MAPPAPRRALDMARTAARQHNMVPSTLTLNSQAISPASLSAVVRLPNETPALLTSAVGGPSRASTSANRRVTSPSSATSPWNAAATPPAMTMSATTASAASARSR